MPATIAFVDARGTNSMVASSAPRRRLASSKSFWPVQLQAVIRQDLEPDSVQLEKIKRRWSMEKSNSDELSASGAPPSCVRNHSLCTPSNSSIERLASSTAVSVIEL